MSIKELRMCEHCGDPLAEEEQGWYVMHGPQDCLRVTLRHLNITLVALHAWLKGERQEEE